MDVDPTPVLAELDLEELTASDADARIPLRQENALWEAMARAAEDPLFGLHAATRHHAQQQQDVLEYTIRTSPTVRHAMHCAIRYNRLFHDVARFRLEEPTSSRGRARFHHYFEGRPRGASLHAADFTVASVVGLVQDLADGTFAVAEIGFQHGAPTDGTSPNAYSDHFGCPITYGNDTNFFGFDAALLDLPLKTADVGMNVVLRRHADDTLEKLPKLDGFAERVRHVVADALAGGDPGIDAVADTLRVSRRTLQRRLDDVGLKFSAVVETLRREMATRYLTDDAIAIAEVAYLLGYSEPSAFHRAFRRWHGVSPAAWRKQRR